VYESSFRYLVALLRVTPFPYDRLRKPLPANSRQSPSVFSVHWIPSLALVSCFYVGIGVNTPISFLFSFLFSFLLSFLLVSCLVSCFYVRIGVRTPVSFQISFLVVPRLYPRCCPVVSTQFLLVSSLVSTRTGSASICMPLPTATSTSLASSMPTCPRSSTPPSSASVLDTNCPFLVIISRSIQAQKRASWNLEL
jgi:hypothetical protein